jgi:hypothetical protein
VDERVFSVTYHDSICGTHIDGVGDRVGSVIAGLGEGGEIHVPDYRRLGILASEHEVGLSRRGSEQFLYDSHNATTP